MEMRERETGSWGDIWTANFVLISIIFPPHWHRFTEQNGGGNFTNPHSLSFFFLMAGFSAIFKKKNYALLLRENVPGQWRGIQRLLWEGSYVTKLARLSPNLKFWAGFCTFRPKRGEREGAILVDVNCTHWPFWPRRERSEMGKKEKQRNKIVIEFSHNSCQVPLVSPAKINSFPNPRICDIRGLTHPKVRALLASRLW